MEPSEHHVDLPALRARWLGRVRYGEAYDLQHSLFDARVAGLGDDYLLLLEHPHTYTLGRRTDPGNLLLDRSEYERFGAEVHDVDRGGDVTYHGPGQLVAYPIMRLVSGHDLPDVVEYVRSLEQVVIDTLGEFEITGFRRDGFTGVWTRDGGAGGTAAKIAAIGCRVTRGVSMHGTAINVSTDLEYFDRIVPCGISNAAVTSVGEICERRGADVPALPAVASKFADHAGRVFGRNIEYVADDRVSHRHKKAAPTSVPVRIRSRRALAVESGPDIREQARSRPAWLKRRAELSNPKYLELARLMRGLGLNTVCEEAGCPNIYECWSDGTATFMLAGSRCTRSCGFCDVDTSKPLPLDPDEPGRVAEAVEKLGLDWVVLTSVARDDLADGAAGLFADTVRAVRDRRPGTNVEVLVPDFGGDAELARTVFAVRPDVFNHNIETVARLQGLARSHAGYARSLTLLARATGAGLVTKSGLIVGLGETRDETVQALADLRSVGVEIVTIGQYLRPSARHLPVDRWVTPDEFEFLAHAGRELGFTHVESGPLVRSSYHAKTAGTSRPGAGACP